MDNQSNNGMNQNMNVQPNDGMMNQNMNVQPNNGMMNQNMNVQSNNGMMGTKQNNLMQLFKNKRNVCIGVIVLVVILIIVLFSVNKGTNNTNASNSDLVCTKNNNSFGVVYTNTLYFSVSNEKVTSAKTVFDFNIEEMLSNGIYEDESEADSWAKEYMDESKAECDADSTCKSIKFDYNKGKNMIITMEVDSSKIDVSGLSKEEGINKLKEKYENDTDLVNYGYNCSVK